MKEKNKKVVDAIYQQLDNDMIPNNFWFRLLSTTITFMILYSGGFFS